MYSLTSAGCSVLQRALHSCSLLCFGSCFLCCALTCTAQEISASPPSANVLFPYPNQNSSSWICPWAPTCALPVLSVCLGPWHGREFTWCCCLGFIPAEQGACPEPFPKSHLWVSACPGQAQLCLLWFAPGMPWLEMLLFLRG